jgi:microcystin-dependent protein
MSEPFIAEIRIFAGNFAPRGWAFCNGQLLPIAQNTALFSLIGTIYGGDGRTTTALPNLQGRAPMGPRSGPGLTTRTLGQHGGATTVTLTEAQMPSHNHPAPTEASAETADSGDPRNRYLAVTTPRIYRDEGTVVDMAPTSTVGGGQAHDNRQPYLGLNFIIALVGLYPSRS